MRVGTLCLLLALKKKVIISQVVYLGDHCLIKTICWQAEFFKTVPVGIKFFSMRCAFSKMGKLFGENNSTSVLMFEGQAEPKPEWFPRMIVKVIFPD